MPVILPPLPPLQLWPPKGPPPSSLVRLKAHIALGRGGWVLQGLEGVDFFMDDILVYGTTEKEHDGRLEKVMQRIETAGLKLNREKCAIRQSQLRFLGHLIDQSGIRRTLTKWRQYGSCHHQQMCRS